LPNCHKKLAYLANTGQLFNQLGPLDYIQSLDSQYYTKKNHTILQCASPMKTIDEGVTDLVDSFVENNCTLDNLYSLWNCLLKKHKLQCGRLIGGLAMIDLFDCQNFLTCTIRLMLKVFNFTKILLIPKKLDIFSSI